MDSSDTDMESPGKGEGTAGSDIDTQAEEMNTITPSSSSLLKSQGSKRGSPKSTGSRHGSRFRVVSPNTHLLLEGEQFQDFDQAAKKKKKAIQQKIVGIIFFLIVLTITIILLVTEYKSSSNLSSELPVDDEILAMVRNAVNSEEELRLKNIVDSLVSFETRNALSSQSNDSVGVGAASKWIKSQMDLNKAVNPNIITYFDDWLGSGGYLPEPVNLTNVVAVLPGSDPNDNRVFVVSGHYDSRASDRLNYTVPAPGADDDASGTAVVLESLRILSSYNFSATIFFVAFTAEEMGLIGAGHLADVFINQSTNLVAMLNNDIVGGQFLSSTTNLSDDSHLRVFSPPGPSGLENESPQRHLARYCKEIGEEYLHHVGSKNWEIELIYRLDRYNRGGDQNPFNDKGFNAIRFTEMNENYYHQHQDVRIENGIQYGDLSDFVNWPYLSRVLGTNIAVVTSLARAPGSPRQVAMNTTTLENTSTLTWLPPLQGFDRVKGYYLLLRRWSSPTWDQRLSFPADSTSATIPYTKDNFIFAVQTYDELGHTSLAISPNS